ncbi:ABC transporter substrate-binding protein [Roseateles amylovorans]|uniref:Leucine-binding protein domain-containing protein n=1 Tax=Roseateles amylovorans TaxID=2978473 RepID=A0ABY6B816_9BURK|nr:hypothetical protein [Roseateles amylovorans]UXH79700.1 hypothetical protein N4261_07255 [Roseateles amylovorans]
MATGLGLVNQARAATIGVILPGSWPSAQQAEELKLGMTLALKTWPGDAAPTLLIKDSACDAKKAQTAVQELIQAKVDVVLGNWCEIGGGADQLRSAGIPLVSSNAERLKDQELQLQLGRIELYAAERIATDLRRETGLRISARTSCWLDFQASLNERVDAVLCPVLMVDKSRWDQVANTYGAAFRKPFTASAARGYAAMEVALNYLRRAKGTKPASALKDLQSMTTLLGPVPAADAPAPSTALQLVFSPQLPKLSPQQAKTVDKLVKTKGCACPGGTLRSGCPKESGPWGELPFVVRGGGTPASCSAPISVLEL